MAYLFRLFGCIFSGSIAEYFGRKKALFVVNIPYVIGWYLLYSSSHLWEIFLGNATLGLAVGLMKSPNVIIYYSFKFQPDN